MIRPPLILALALAAGACRKTEPEPPSEGYGTSRVVTGGGARTGTPQVARLAFTSNTANAKSPIGVHLSGFGYKSGEVYALDQMTQATAWRQADCRTTPDAAQSLTIGSVTLDTDGWPKTIPTGTCAGVGLFYAMQGTYPAGKWLVKFDGEATLVVTGDATTVKAESAGVASFQVATPSPDGVFLMVKDTHAVNPMKRIRVIPPGGVCGIDPTNVDPFKQCKNDRGGEGTCSGDLVCIDFADALIDQYASDAEQNFAHRVGVGAGAWFHPAYLDSLKSYRTIGFRRWLQPDFSTAEPTRSPLKASLGERAHTTGAPWELMFALTNVLSADAWLTLPALMKGPVSNELATVTAAQTFQQLGVYLENYYEWWIPGSEGDAVLGDLAARYNSTVPLLHVGIADPMKKTWDTALGTGRLKMVGSVEASDPTAPATLRQPSGAFPWTHYATSHRIVVPSGGYVPPDPKTLTDAMANSIRARGVPMIAYGGGLYLLPTLSSNDARTATRQNAEYGTAVTQALTDWKAAGGQLYMFDRSADDESTGLGTPDAWGVRGTPVETAIQSFIAANPCWWAGCER